MSIARPLIVASLLGMFAGGTLTGCGQKGPLVQPDAAPKHKKIAPPKAPANVTPKAPVTPVTPGAPSAPSAPAAPTDPQP